MLSRLHELGIEVANWFHLIINMSLESLHFTEEKMKLDEADKHYEKVRQDISSEAYGSEEYWRLLKLELTIQRDIEDMQWTEKERSYNSKNDKYYDAKERYLTERAELKAKHDSAVRKEDRHKKRAAVISFVKTNNLVSSRAAYVELLMNRFKKASRTNQPQLKEDLKRTYGARKVPDGDEEVWSPVVEGGWIAKVVTKAAHIVPLSVSQESMNYIFGRDAKGEINSARNGLWLPSNFAERFNNFQIAIVPAGQSRQWQVLVIDPDEIRNGEAYGNKKFKDLHGAKLVFQNDAQPRARYFYFHYLCAMLDRSQKTKEKKLTLNDNAVARMSEPSRAWGSEGSYLRENVILGFFERLGDSVGDDGAEMIRSHSGGKIAPNEAERLGTSVGNLDLDSEDEDEDDEDE